MTVIGTVRNEYKERMKALQKASKHHCEPHTRHIKQLIESVTPLTALESPGLRVNFVTQSPSKRECRRLLEQFLKDNWPNEPYRLRYNKEAHSIYIYNLSNRDIISYFLLAFTTKTG